MFLIPSRVQGAGASDEIVSAIRLAQRLRPPLDLLIVGGGGSMEDLWCFNEEPVVRALAQCRIPTVSAVGHEIDVTLSDLAADARAMTPSQAAGLVLPNRSELQSLLTQQRRRLDHSVRSRLLRIRQRLDGLSQRGLLARPHRIYLGRKQQLDELENRLGGAMSRSLQLRRGRLSELARAAEALSPLQVLQRGYSLTTRLGQTYPLTSYRQLEVGDSIATRLSEGVVVSRVESANDSSPEWLKVR